MTDNIEILKDIMQKGIPILFLGAGFSYGSTNKEGELPTGEKLTEDIFNYFIKGKVEPIEEKEIEKYDLQDMCQTVNDYLNQSKDLKEYLFKRFKHAKPEEFHYNLLSYPWRRIYTVNIDDIVENIYRKSDIKIVVQNSEKEKNVDRELEYIKLHGCVNAEDEPIVFSKTEYTNLISKSNYKLDKLTTDILSRDMIFIGASLDERDIDYYITKYENAGFMKRGKLIFIDPYPNVKLRTRIKSLGGILIQWTTKEFLEFVKELKYNPSEQIKAKKMLNYNGMYCYNDIMDCFDETQVYESRLYEGYECKWEDVFFDWIIETKPIIEIQHLVEQVRFDLYDSYCIAIVGNCFTGKSCILKKMGMYLNNNRYEVIEYVGKILNIDCLKKYIESSESDRFALLVDNASFYYKHIEKILQGNFCAKKLLIITTSRPFYHSKKKYYLDNNPYEEYFVEDKICKEDVPAIYDKIRDKGYLGGLSLESSDGIQQINKYQTYINLFSFLTYGSGFKRRVANMSASIFDASNKIVNLFVELVIFDKADLSYYPGELISSHYSIDYNIFISKNYSLLNRDQQLLVDNIGIDVNGIFLRNQLLINEIWKNLSSERKRWAIYTILKNISSYVSEDDETYWRIIFESLLKEDRMVKQFGLNSRDVLPLFYGVKNEYKKISYYWLQLGIAEQRTNDFSKALNHLQIAEQIRPKAYQIQHAIARNYLKHANIEKEQSISENLFATGENLMLDLINSKEHYKKKAKNFSIHCYTYEKICYLEKHPKLIDKKTCERIKKYIDMIILDDDKYIIGLVAKFTKLLSENGFLSMIRMTPDDIYFRSLSVDGSKYNIETDLLVDSI